MAPLRVVLDTNVVISALLRPGGAPGRILRAAIDESAIVWITSDALLAELQTALAGRADVIVSGDAGLLVLRDVEHIPILAPSDFEPALGHRRKDDRPG